FVAELVHPENRDDVLQFLVTLEELLRALRGGVVFFAEDSGVEDPARRLERIDGRVDPERSDLPRKHSRRVKVRKRGSRRGVGQVVRRHVNRLNRSYGTGDRKSDVEGKSVVGSV